MSDPDPDAERRRRQAPQYGEYATPEEVAALRGPDAPPLIPVEASPPPPPIGRPVPGPPPEGHRRPAGWDGILTVGLLVFGAYNVFSALIGFFDMRAFVAQVAQAAGLGDVTIPAGVQTLGYAMSAVWVASFVAAIAWSMRRMRHGRIAFWVPLLVGSVVILGTSFVVLIVLQASGAGAVLQNQT